jgi:Protein of unknown function (DUF4239)
MELWLVREVPTWLVGLVLIGGLPALTLGLDALIHRTMPHRRLGRHNAVTGVIVSVVGVAYAVVIGLCVVSLWEGYTDAEHTVRDEAVSLTGLVPASAVFGTDVQRRVTDDIVRYERDLIVDWNARQRDGAEARRTADLDRLAATVAALQPATEAQRAFVQQAVAAIARAGQLRHESLSEAGDRGMSTVMWIGVLGATVAILFMCLFFGLDDHLLRRILLALSGAVIATNLFLIVQMNYPYHGSFAVTPGSYEEVVKDLRVVP